MNDISEIFNVDPNSWIESLSTYQKNIINQLYSQTNDYEVVANTWLTATIPMNVPFGTQKNPSIFFEKVLDEIEAFLTGDEKLHTPLKKCSLTADDGASPPLKWCTNSAEMVHGGRRRGARGRHAGNHSGMPLRLRMDSPSIWMV